MEASARRSLHRDLIRLADGDRSAFDAVYEAAWPVVRATCTHVLGDAVIAEDVAQDALIDLFRDASRFDPTRGDALAWILACATWKARSERTRRFRRGEVDVIPDVVDSALASSLERQDLLRSVARTAVGLDPTDAATVETLLSDEGLPPGAKFRKRVERATRRLVELWRQDVR